MERGNSHESPTKRERILDLPLGCIPIRPGRKPGLRSPFATLEDHCTLSNSTETLSTWLLYLNSRSEVELSPFKGDRYRTITDCSDSVRGHRALSCSMDLFKATLSRKGGDAADKVPVKTSSARFTSGVCAASHTRF